MKKKPPHKKPLMVDLFSGIGGWAEGGLAEGYDVLGFDIERHDYGEGKRYPAQLVLQDVRTLLGRQFKDARLIVASPPCQFFSYCAMPWSRAKALAAEVRADPARVDKELELFRACFRIQREAIEAAGHFIPMVVENVRGAQPWVGRAAWNFGSYYLWGNVPALMPITQRAHKVPGFRFDGNGGSFQSASVNVTGVKAGDRNIGAAAGEHKWSSSFADHFKFHGMNWSDRSIKGQDFTRVAGQQAGLKTVGHVNRRDGYTYTRHLTNQVESSIVKGFTPNGRPIFDIRGRKDNSGRDLTNYNESDGVKQHGSGREWFAGEGKISRTTSSKSNARKAASAQIAKIPFVLSQWIARVWKNQ